MHSKPKIAVIRLYMLALTRYMYLLIQKIAQKQKSLELLCKISDLDGPFYLFIYNLKKNYDVDGTYFMRSIF